MLCFDFYQKNSLFPTSEATKLSLNWLLSLGRRAELPIIPSIPCGEFRISGENANFSGSEKHRAIRGVRKFLIPVMPPVFPSYSRAEDRRGMTPRPARHRGSAGMVLSSCRQDPHEDGSGSNIPEIH